VFPGGFYIDPVNRQYLTDKVNSIFRLIVELPRSSEGGKKKFPAENSEESDSVHLTDQLSNFGIIPDYLKVIDFVEEMGDLLTKIVQREISTFTMVDPSEV
jgi:hypothetical protein